MDIRRSTTARWRFAVTLLGVGVVVAAVPASAPAQSASLDRSLLDQYCVTCHNETLRTGGLALDSVDVQNVAAHAEVLERSCTSSTRANAAVGTTASRSR